MRNKILLLMTVAPIALLLPAVAHAQANAKTVTVCSAQTYTVGQSYPLTQNPAGQLCDTGGAGNISVGNVSLGCSTAQIGVVTPLSETTTNISGTVTTGAAFQNISAASSARKGCLIQNPIAATETLYVYFGAGTAAEGNSTNLGAGSGVSCATGSGILGDEIQVTGNTTGHAFVATVQ